jgi:hypothetical protein
MDELTIEFEGSTAADAARLAEGLATHVNATVDGVKAAVATGDTDAMDFGATVTLLLGAPSIIILARGIADWIRRQGDPTLVIKRGRDSVVVKGGLDQATKRELILTALGHPPD